MLYRQNRTTTNQAYALVVAMPTFLAVLISFRGARADEAANDSRIVAIAYSELSGAVKGNLAWAAARYRIDEARARLLQSGRLPNPEIEIEGSHDTKFREGTFGLALTQAFPLTARLDLERAVSRAELAVAEAEVNDALRMLEGKARTIGVRYLVMKEQLTVHERNRMVATELAASLEASTAAGEVPATDGSQAMLEVAQSSLAIGKLEAEAERILAELHPILGLDPSVPVVLEGALGGPVESPSQGALVSNRPDYIAAKRAEEAARQEILLEEARRREDISIGVFTEAERAEDAPEGLENEFFTGLRISIPLPIWNKNEGSVREKEAKANRLEAEREALALEIRSAAAAARAEMTASARRAADISDQLLPLATDQERQLDKAYREGQGTLQAVLQARRQITAMELERIEALRDYHLAKVRLETALPPSPQHSSNLPPKQ